MTLQTLIKEEAEEMSDNGSIIPISDEQAKLGQEIIKAFSSLGSFFKDALGSVPSDLVGYMGGDWLRMRRAENIAKMMNLTREKLETRGVKFTEPASLTVALPILRGSADESREELQDLWARLMAAALDPSRSGKVRQGFAEVVSKMDPVDALALEFLNNKKTIRNKAYDGGNQLTEYANELNLSKDELETSVWHLSKLELLDEFRMEQSGLTAFARELLLVVSD